MQLVPAGAGFVPLSRPAALDYAAVEATARMAGIDMTAARFGDLRALEAGAVSVFAEAAGSRA